MIDRYLLSTCVKVLRPLAKVIQGHISASGVTLLGVALLPLILFLLAHQLYGWALCCILANRLLDGLDGELARLQGPTDAGAYLDSACDFLFYAGVVFGFALADPSANGLSAALLLFSFMGTCSTFLLFALFAEKHNLQSSIYPHKGFYYLAGITEGGETIFAFTLFALFPKIFPQLATLFALLCFLTTAMRIFFSWKKLRE